MITSTAFRRWLQFCLVVLLAGCAPAVARPAGVAVSGSLAAELDAIFGDPAFGHATWGALIRSLDSGETIYALNADRLFLPASNVKLLTGAAALETLGPDYRYGTTISAAGAIRDGVLSGPLVITGSGDPTFSARFLEEPRDAFRAWADSLRSHGITRVAGGIVAVDTAFVGPPLGAGWMWDDLLGRDAAEFGALQFNESSIELDLFPASAPPQPALVVLTPPTQSVRIINETRTVPAGGVTALRFERDEFGSGLVVRGEIAADSEPVRRGVSVPRPAHYFANVVRETLREQGIAVEGPAIHHTELEEFDPTVRNAIPLFTHRSPPLREMLPGMLKPSQNQLAETMLLTVGREVRGRSTAVEGVAVVDSLLRAWEVPEVRMSMVDGSGMSRYNLASPALLVGLLERMNRSYYADVWRASLPLAGREGTLAARMREPPLIEMVRAKTGSLRGTRSLSGYLTTERGENVVFSIMVNNHVLTAAEADRIVEAALSRVALRR